MSANSERVRIRWSSGLRSALLLVVSTAITLLLTEAGFRVYSRVARPKMMALDGALGWRHPVNVSRRFVNESGEKVVNVLNADGNRGPVPRPTRDSVVRILALGDSFTEGWAVGEDDLVTAIIAAGDPRLEVINAGVGGYGTVQQYLFATTRGLAYDPDLVVALVYENDFTDNLRSSLPEFGPRPHAVIDGAAVRIVDTLDHGAFDRFLLPIPFRRTLHRHSYAYYFLNRAYQRVTADRMRQMVLADYRGVSNDDLFRVLFTTLTWMDSALGARAVPLFVVQIPTREDVANARSVIADRFMAECAARGLRCHSLYPRFVRERSAGRPLYFPVDIHWTRDGHRVAGEEVLAALRANGIIDSLAVRKPPYRSVRRRSGATSD